MIRNYLLISLRSLVRDSKTTAIHVIGLTIGITAFFLIMLWVNYQMSYDKFHTQINRIYRVMADRSEGTNPLIEPNTPYPLSEVLEEQAGIEKVARYYEGDNILLTGKNYKQNERLHFVDQEFIEMFDFPFIQGDRNRALTDQNSIILSENAARRYFGEEQALGKMLSIKGWGYERDLTVTGVLSDIPSNSSLTFDFLLPIEILASEYEWFGSWGTASLFTYVLLKEEADAPLISNSIKDIPGQNHDWKYELFLFPAVKTHLYNVFNDRTGGGRITYVYIFATAAVLILLLACINFTNLSTARAGRRAREIGVRKSMGANAQQVRTQIIIEGILISLCAMFISLSLIQILLPAYNNLLGTSFETGWISWSYLISLFVIAVLTGIIAGIYPAIIYSRFNPVEVLKSAFSSSSQLHWSKQLLVIFQLVISVIMITSAIIIYRQVSYLNSSDIGFNKNNLLYFNIHENGVYGHHKEFATLLEQHPDIEQVTYMSQNPLQVYQTSGDPFWEGKNPEIGYPHIAFVDVDFDVEEVLDIEILKGRSFSRDVASDTASFLINEKAAAIIGDDAVGKRMSFWDKEGSIIGVFKDFHHLSFHNEIKPMILRYWRGNTSLCFLRVQGNLQETLAFIETNYKLYEKEYPFSYQFVDKEFEQMYAAEKQIQLLVSIFAGMAIVISLLGLYGLVAFVLQRQVKMIGIRKVLGASTLRMIRMFTYRFLIWVITSIAIAFPISYYIMLIWMENFAYRIEITFTEFVVAALLILIITLTTILYQVIRAAQVNPVECLKNE
jgi:ABC-type antimicrobial peptide transport system permease subunit